MKRELNRGLLMWTHDNLHAALTQANQGTGMTTEKKLNVIMLSLADMCALLASDSEDDEDDEDDEVSGHRS